MRLLALSLVLILFVGCVQIPLGPKSGTGSSVTTGGTNASSGEGASSGTGETGGDETTSETASEEETGTGETSSIPSEEITFKSGAWNIYGTMYKSVNKDPTKLIVLVHRLGSDRNSYPQYFVEELHTQFPEALIVAIDLRGHGKSINLGRWDNFDTATFKDMRADVFGVSRYLAPKFPTVSKVYVIGESIGSSAAILAAEQEKPISKIVMLSPGMAYRDVDITAAVDDFPHPLLVVVSSQDSYSVQAASQIEGLRDESITTVKTYGGSAHGTGMFDATKDTSEPLTDEIVEFLKK